MYFFGAWGCRWGLRDVSILLCNNKNRKESDSWRTSCSSNGKESAGDQGSNPGLGRSTGEENGNPLQYSWLENSIDREAWRATVHGVPKSRTRLSDSHTHTQTHTHSWRASEIWWLSSQWRTSWRRKYVCGCSLPAPKKTWKASQKCVKDMVWHLPWNLTAVFFLSPYNLWQWLSHSISL